MHANQQHCGGWLTDTKAAGGTAGASLRAGPGVDAERP